MKITQIQNGDSGLVARTVINESLKSVDTDSSISGDGNTGNALSVIGLSAIAKTITATAKAIYIYDTSKDIIDWRHNENASWYNEPLNTATRGATRELPSVALIVAETNKITVYDATNTLLPMWRVFNTVAFQGWGSFNSISCKNGVIYLTANQNDGINGNLQVIDFINNEVSIINSTGTYVKNTGSSIADSNIAGTASIYTSTTTKLIHNTALDLVIATLKDGTDVVYVATQAGLTRISSDGSVSNWNDLGGTFSYVASVSINNDRVFFSVLNNQDALRVISQPVDMPLVNTASTTGMAYSGLSTDIHTNALTPLHTTNTHTFSLRVAEKALFSAKGLYLIKPNYTAYGLGLHATITSSFNSGYQYGDIKGAWLTNTVAGTVTGGTVADRSYNNLPLTINGTLTKTPVNTGCELVGYGGFSAGNTLTITKSLASSDLYLSCWILGNTNTISQYAVSAGDPGTLGAHRAIAVLSGEFSLVLWGTALDLKSGVLQQAGVWAKVEATINNTTGECEIFVNGRSTAKAIRTLTAFTSTTVSVGMRNDNVAGYFTSDLTLARISSSIPTREQIAYAYNQEKHLFNKNTACTLAGTSDDCKVVDYDSDTGLHHVATTTDKSVFKGLVRVSSKVGAFTSVSAQNDYVAEA